MPGPAPARNRKERLIRSRRKRAVGAAVICTAVGTTLLVLSLFGIGIMFDALAQIAASVCFAAAAIFLIVGMVIQRGSRRLAITYQPPASSQQSDETR